MRPRTVFIETEEYKTRGRGNGLRHERICQVFVGGLVLARFTMDSPDYLSREETSARAQAFAELLAGLFGLQVRHVKAHSNARKAALKIANFYAVPRALLGLPGGAPLY